MRKRKAHSELRMSALFKKVCVSYESDFKEAEDAYLKWQVSNDIWVHRRYEGDYLEARENLLRYYPKNRCTIDSLGSVIEEQFLKVQEAYHKLKRDAVDSKCSKVKFFKESYYSDIDKLYYLYQDAVELKGVNNAIKSHRRDFERLKRIMPVPQLKKRLKKIESDIQRLQNTITFNNGYIVLLQEIAGEEGNSEINETREENCQLKAEKSQLEEACEFVQFRLKNIGGLYNSGRSFFNGVLKKNYERRSVLIKRVIEGEQSFHNDTQRLTQLLRMPVEDMVKEVCNQPLELSDRRSPCSITLTP